MQRGEENYEVIIMTLMLIKWQLFKAMSNWVISGIMLSGNVFITLWRKLQEGTIGFLCVNMIPFPGVMEWSKFNYKTYFVWGKSSDKELSLKPFSPDLYCIVGQCSISSIFLLSLFHLQVSVVC